ncbi:MAG: T9SS type A sorting domain-containing protein, partial [Flavobacteriales bacterium]|nr:T9SS type A sorting domain-containing protein [Flavobacteriales bacterium]
LFPDTSTACGPPWATNVAEVQDASGLGQVYPNPFDREATLQLDPTAGFVERWVLLNSLGQVLEQGGGTRHQVRISGAGMPDGVYLLRWWNGQGWSGTVRVVKGG